MYKIITATGALLLAAPLASADVLGLGATAGYWNSDLTGEAANNGSTVDMENDLNLDSSDNLDLAAYLEHPVPVLPNLRLAYTDISQSGRGQLSGGFNGITGGTEVQSDFELQQLDVTLYYELLDNWVNLDLGLTARDLDGELTVSPTTGPGPVSRTEVDAVLPMVYAAARFDLPLTGVSLGVEGNGIGYDGDSVYDVNAYGQYQLSLLQLRAGYRQMAIDYEDGDERLDVEIGGPFVSAGLIF